MGHRRYGHDRHDHGRTLGVTIEEITWVVTGYMLSNVFVMPLIAWLSARFGRKQMYVAGVLWICGF